MRNARSRSFFAWWLSFCLAGLALAASAQSQNPGQNPNPNGPVVIPTDTTAQPQPSVQTQPSADAWDRWKIQKVSDEDDWTRHFRIGAFVGLNISANFSTKGTFTLPDNAANGIYDDGYVRADETGNAQGYTSYWGYNNPSQLSGSKLAMSSTTSYDVTDGSSKENGSGFAGFDMAYGGNLFYLGRARIGWDLGFGLLPINITDNSSMSATVHKSVYTFDTGTIVVPGAPYQGGPSGIGPTILTNFNFSQSTDTELITGSHTLDVMLYTVRLGPSVYWDLNEYLGLSVGAGPAVGIVSGNLQYNEKITTDSTVTSNRGQVNGTDVVYGGYVNASLMYHVQEHGDLYVGVQYMSLGNATISGGGRSGQLNLGGQVYISAGINWPF